MTTGSSVIPTVHSAASSRTNVGVQVSLRIEFRDADGKLTDVYCNDHDTTLQQLAIMVQTGLMAVGATSIRATDNTTQNTTGAMTANTPTIDFGTGVTAAAFTDHAIQTEVASGAPVAAVVNALSTNTFTVTATWSNATGGSVTVSEVAMLVTSTAGVASNKTYALTHDTFTGVAVSNGGTAAATLTFTWT